MTAFHYPWPERRTPVFPGKNALLALLAGLLLGACASSPENRRNDRSQSFRLDEPGYGGPTALSARSNDVLMRAIGLVGTPYRYGGNTPESGFDCSGLVDFVFMHARADCTRCAEHRQIRPATGRPAVLQSRWRADQPYRDLRW